MMLIAPDCLNFAGMELPRNGYPVDPYPDEDEFLAAVPQLGVPAFFSPYLSFDPLCDARLNSQPGRTPGCLRPRRYTQLLVN